MKKLAIMLLIMFSAGFSYAKDSVEYVSTEYTIVVPKSDDAVREIIDSSKRLKGTVLFYSPSRVVMRMPANKFTEMAEIVKRLGFIDDEKNVRTDVGEELAKKKAQLKVKEDYLSKLYKLTEEADFGGTLNAERAIETAISEIDNLRSQIRKYERMSRNVDIVVLVNGPRQTPSDRGASRWDALNTLGVEHCMKEGR